MTVRVLVVGAHTTSGWSMKRYTRLLCRGWAETGAQVVETIPPDVLTRRVTDPRLRKWTGYIEKFIVYPWKLRRRARAADLVHIADHSDALWALVLPRSCRVVITCHDLIAVRAALGELPEHRTGASGRLYQWLVRKGLLRAEKVLSVSAATAADVERLVGHQPRVLYNPLDPSLAVGTGESGTTRALVPTAVGGSSIHLPEFPYLLVVSTAGWRKRREAAFQAWAALRRTSALADIGLVLVGPGLTEPERVIERQHPSARLKVQQQLPDDALRSLYENCVALVLLSRYEGFGWPIVEAQVAGRPVLATDSPVHREIGGQGCVYVDMENFAERSQAAWEAMAEQLKDPALLSAGVENIERFAWPKFVAELSQNAARISGHMQNSALSGKP